MITVAFSGEFAQFDGPLDLLLALVRRNQYPLENLPIAEITSQYLTYTKDAQQADVELAPHSSRPPPGWSCSRAGLCSLARPTKSRPRSSSRAPCSITRLFEQQPACCAAASMPQAQGRAWIATAERRRLAER